MDMYEELEADLLDRFGEYPDEVAHLLTTGRIKIGWRPCIRKYS